LGRDYDHAVLPTQSFCRLVNVALLAVVVLAAAGCSSTTPQETGSPAPSVAGAADALGAPSRQTLIATALADGRIDLVTSLEYRAYALFDMPDLPPEFADANPVGDDAALFDQIVDVMPTLSDEDQERLRRFVARPTEPDSIFSGAGETAGGGAADIRLVVDVGPRWAISECRDWVDSGDIDARFKVWACAGTDPAAAGRDAATVAGMMEQIWGPMTQEPPVAMGPPIPDGSGPNVPREFGGDGRIDIYLVGLGEVVQRGGPVGLPAGRIAAAVPSPPYVDATGAPVRTSSGFMVVNRTRIGDRDQMLRDLIHEFFHVLQKAHNRTGPLKGSEHHWFGEASATWAETYYYRQQSEFVHTWYESDFQKSPLGLEAADENHQYAAYIWPFFMEQEGGSTAVFKAWVGIESATAGDFKAVTDAIDAQIPFAANFRDFAVRNLQVKLEPMDPAEPRYQELDGNFPEDKLPQIAEGQVPASESYFSPAQAIEPLAATYFKLEVAGEAREVTIDLAGLSPEDNLDGDVLLHIVDHWERRPIEDGELRLCRDDPADDVDTMYVVLSNHGREGKISGEFEVRPRDQCAPGGYNITLAGQGLGGESNQTAGHYEGDGRVICTLPSSGSWIVSAVFYADDPEDPATDILGFDITTEPGSRSVAVTLIEQNVEGPGWFVNERLRPDATFSFDITDSGERVTITAVASDENQQIEITVNCSMINRS